MQTQPSLTVAVMNDLHVGGLTSGGFQNAFLVDDAGILIGPTVEAINRIAPDLVLIPGDLTQDATPEQLARVTQCLDDLQAPWMVCKGNHDRETLGAAARFDVALGKRARPGITHGTELGLPDSTAVLILECSWRPDGQPYAPDNPPNAVVEKGLVDQTLADLDEIRPGLLLVACHYPLVSQAEYVASVNGNYAGHVEGGVELLDELTARAGMVVCCTGHNHYHHVMTGKRWLQCGTGALAEYPAEYRTLTVEKSQVTISSSTAVREVLESAPQPAHLWVAGRPQDRQLTWRVG